MRSNADSHQRVELGKFGKVFGIKGWLRLISYTNPPENILTYGSLYSEIDGNWTTLDIDQSQLQANGLVVHVKGFDEPETARTLTGTGIWIDSSALPALPAGEYYWHQLEGLSVVNQHGELLGEVTELMATGANDVLVVAATASSIDDRERLIPYLSGSVVKKVSLDDGLIDVDWEADYLE